MYIKNRIISNIVQIISLIIVISFTILIIKPAKDRLEHEIIDKRDELFKNLENQTGLSFEYGAISPLVVDSIVLKDLHVKSNTSDQSVNISKITIKFSLFNIIRSRWKKIDAPSLISKIYLDNGDVRLDFVNFDIIDKFVSSTSAPSNAYFKGIVLLNDIDVYLNFNKFKIEALNTSGSLSGRYGRYLGNIETKASFISNMDKVFNYINGDVDFKGYFSRTFKGINSEFSIKNCYSDIGTIKNLVATFDMENEEVKIKNSDKKSNFDYLYIFRIPIYEHYFNVKTENLVPGEIFTPSADFHLIDDYLNSTVNGDFSGTYSMIYNTFLYQAEGNLKHYDNKIPLSINSNFNLVGDLDHVTFKNLNLSTNYGYLGFIGGLDFHSLFPQGNFYLRNIKAGDNISFDSDLRVRVINDNFISLNFDYIKGAGVSVSDISSILYIDDEDITLQGLKKDSNGKISISSNYNFGSKSLSSSILVDNFKLNFLDSIITSSFVKNKVDKSRISFEANLDYSNDLLKYSVDNLILKDEKDIEILEVEGVGTNDSFVLDYLKVDLPNLDIQGRLEGTFLENNIKLSLDSLINDNKYNVNIDIIDNTVKVLGNYGLDLNVILGETLYVNLKAKDFPIKYKTFNTVSTLNLNSAIFNDGNFLLSIPEFETKIKSSLLPFDPNISFSVDGSNDQISIYNLTYLDGTTPLKGDFRIIKENTEAYSLSASLSDGSNENIKINSFISSDFKTLNMNLVLEDFLLDRLHNDIFSGRNSATINFNGTKESFIAEGSFESDDFTLLTNSAGLNLNLKLTEEMLTLSDFNGFYNKNKISLPILTYNYKNGDLISKLDLGFFVGELPSSSSIAVDMNFKPVDQIFDLNSNSFSNFNGKITILNLIAGEDTLFTNKGFRLFNNSAALQIYSMDRNFKLLYSYISGLLNSKITKPYFSALNLTGKVKDRYMDVSVRDLNLDASIVNMFFGIGNIDSLDLHGQLNIEGPVSNPLMNGLLWADLDLSLDNIPEYIEPTRINLRAEDSKFTILNSTMKIGEESLVNLGGEINFNAWAPESIMVKVDIPYEYKVPIEYQYSLIIADTHIYTPGIVYYMDDSGSLLTGEAVIDEGEFYTQMLEVLDLEGTDSDETVVKENVTDIEIDLTVEIGKGNELYWPSKSLPILDATLKSGDSVKIKYKSITGEFDVNGKVSIINGEVDYSGNPFYLTEGSVDLNLSNDNIDPYINLLASKTVLDEDDRQVEVYLSFEGGFFSDFSPTFSADDASKSEDEISSLIGTAVTGDSFGDLIFDVADEVATSYLTAPFEEGIKDIINVDNVKIESGFISALLTNITNNSFDSTDDTSYTVAEMFSETSVTLGNFVTDDFFGKLSIGSLYEDDELNLDVNLGLTLYAPHFQLGFNVNPKFGDNYVFEPELELSLDWVYKPNDGN